MKNFWLVILAVLITLVIQNFFLSPSKLVTNKSETAYERVMLNSATAGASKHYSRRYRRRTIVARTKYSHRSAYRQWQDG